MSKPLDPDLTALAGYEAGRADARRAIAAEIERKLLPPPSHFGTDYFETYQDVMNDVLALLRPDGEK